MLCVIISQDSVFRPGVLYDPRLVVTLVSHCSGVSWWKSHVRPLHQVVAIAWSQQALSVSFIRVERIYS